MKTITLSLKIIALSLLLVNCSSDDAKSAATSALPATVTTEPIGNIVAASVELNGRIVSAGSGIMSFGFCISEEANPTTSDMIYIQGGSPNGNFTKTIMLPKPSTIYHVRAYAKTLAGTSYGQDYSFMTNFYIDSDPVADITTKAAYFKGRVLSLPENNFYSMGYCYNTLPNPTPANNVVEVDDAIGAFSETTFDNLLPNTVYYVRPYYSSSSVETYYGQEMTFKTAGYFGPGGGYVAYDKGTSTDGWRYLEVYPQTLNYYSNITGALWGCNTTLLTNTYPEMGKGLQNTQLIVSNCGAANSAAMLCNNYVRNGLSDWFLGSRDEMTTITNSMRLIGIDLFSAWTSSETLAGTAYAMDYDSSPPSFFPYQESKSSYMKVYPVRRY